MRRIAWRAVTILSGLLPAAIALAAPDPTAPVPGARFDIARDITVSLSALGAALFAILGVNAWHRQLKGTTEYQIALRALKAVYAVRESMIEARGRVTFPLDGDAQGAGSKGREELRVLQEAQSYQRRLTRVGSARADLFLAQQEALALWGEEAKESLEDLSATIGELFATYDQYFEAELERARREDREGAVADRDAEGLLMNRILYSRPETDGKDPFGKRLARAVSKAEEFYRDRLG